MANWLIWPQAAKWVKRLKLAKIPKLAPNSAPRSRGSLSPPNLAWACVGLKRHLSSPQPVEQGVQDQDRDDLFNVVHSGDCRVGDLVISRPGGRLNFGQQQGC